MKNNWFSLVFVAFLVLAGCATRNTHLSDKVITAAELRNFIKYTNNLSTLFGAELILDEQFIIPKESWIQAKFIPAYTAFLFSHSICRYSDQRNDCDNFAQYGVAVANIINNRDNSRSTGIAVGEYLFFSNPPFESHVILIMVVEDKKSLKLVLLDPFDNHIYDLEKEFDVLSRTPYWRF